jgi:hypothetical protein
MLRVFTKWKTLPLGEKCIVRADFSQPIRWHDEGENQIDHDKEENSFDQNIPEEIPGVF